MTDLVDIASRETLVFTTILCIGAAPATYLPRSFTTWLRVAMAPILGLCIAVCVFTTIEWFFDGYDVRWLVLVVMLASLGEAFRHWNATKRLSDQHDDSGHASPSLAVIQILLICVAVSLPPAFLLASQHSVGPTVYEIYDSPGYVADVDGAQMMSIGMADHVKPPFASYEVTHWINQVQTNNRLDISPFAASVNSLFGLHETEVWAAYLLAVLAAGALALYAAICVATGRQTWFAVAGASLFGGAFFLQLLTDGSQAAIAGLTLVVPSLLFIRITKAEPSIPNLLISSLLLAGLSTLYPILVLPLVATAVLYLVALAIRSSGIQWRELLVGLVRDGVYVVGVILAASVFDLVATSRNVSSWLSLIEGGGASASQPQYHLGFGVIASWLLQTRDFYSVAFGPQSPFSDVVPALLVPILVVIAAYLGIRRARWTWVPLAFIGLSLLVATKQVAAQSCSYCENRSLLPVVPASLFVIFTAVASYHMRSDFKGRSFAAGVVAILLVFAGASIDNERIRFATAGIFLPDTVQQAVAAIPSSAMPVELEGFGTVPYPVVLAEETPPYEALAESVSHGVSYLGHEPGQGVPTDLSAALSIVKPSFDADYQYILTRVPQIATGRRVIFERDGVAIELRHQPLDVTIETGLAALIRPSWNGGIAGWVNGQMTFIVTGKTRAIEQLQLKFTLPSPRMKIPKLPGMHYVRDGVFLSVCVPIVGVTPVQTVYATVPPNRGIVLSSMRASYGSCP